MSFGNAATDIDNDDNDADADADDDDTTGAAAADTALFVVFVASFLVTTQYFFLPLPLSSACLEAGDGLRFRRVWLSFGDPRVGDL